MAEVRQTDLFRKWFAALRDVNAKRRIAQRIVRLQSGLMGDVKPVGDGVSEPRSRRHVPLGLARVVGAAAAGSSGQK